MNQQALDELMKKFHDKVDELCTKHALGYVQAIDALMVAGVLADQGMDLRTIVYRHTQLNRPYFDHVLNLLVADRLQENKNGNFPITVTHVGYWVDD